MPTLKVQKFNKRQGAKSNKYGIKQYLNGAGCHELTHDLQSAWQFAPCLTELYILVLTKC